MRRIVFAVIGALISVAAGAATCDVRSYGARGDGATPDTAAIQRAINDCAAHGGGTVLLPPGRYRSGTIALASHIVLKLDAGATLIGSRDLAAYKTARAVGLGTTLGVDVAGEGDRAGLIVAREVTDVSIVGPGTIDGDGDAFMTGEPHVAADFAAAATRNPAGSAAAVHDRTFGPLEPAGGGRGRPGVLVLFFHATGVTVRDVTLADSPNWTLVFQDVTRATVSGFHITNSLLIPNNDGIDCNHCRDVHISDGDIRAGDDDIAVSETEDITVDNVSMTSRSAAIRIESTQRAVFSNLTIVSNRGLALFASARLTRPTDGVVFANIVVRTQLIPGHWWGKGEPIYMSVQRCTAGACAGGIRNVAFQNIDAEAEAGVVIAGAPGLPVTGVTLSNVRLTMRAPPPAMATRVGGNFDRRWTAATPAEGIVAHDIPAIYCGDVAGLTVRDVVVDWVGRQPDYTTAAIACEGFTDVTVDGLDERGDAPPGPRLSFADGTRLRLARITSPGNFAGSAAAVGLHNVTPVLGLGR